MSGERGAGRERVERGHVVDALDFCVGVAEPHEVGRAELADVDLLRAESAAPDPRIALLLELADRDRR